MSLGDIIEGVANMYTTMYAIFRVSLFSDFTMDVDDDAMFSLENKLREHKVAYFQYALHRIEKHILGVDEPVPGYEHSLLFYNDAGKGEYRKNIDKTEYSREPNILKLYKALRELNQESLGFNVNSWGTRIKELAEDYPDRIFGKRQKLTTPYGAGQLRRVVTVDSIVRRMMGMNHG